MEIAKVQEAGALILGPSGRIDGQNALDFQASVDTAIGDSTDPVILELNNLTYISSAGLRVILLLAKTLKSRSVPFSMCDISAAVKEVFEISGFGNTIAIHDTRADALHALND